MGFGFRKSIKIAPGIKINLSKSGISTSIGGKGLTYNTRGRVTASVPGTGLRYTANLTGRGARGSVPERQVQYQAQQQYAPTAGKRELANEEFLDTLRRRSSRAIQNYFFSHGVCVDKADFTRAIAMPEHRDVFSPLESPFAQINEAASLLVDIGSLSLPAKEKAMRAIYAVEARLMEFRGPVEHLGLAIAQVHAAQEAVPQKPKAWPYAVGGSAFMLLAFVAVAWTIVGVIIYSVGAGKLYAYKRRKSLADEALREANATFDQLAMSEVTARYDVLIR
jgi:hypothetical protein